MKKDLSKEIDRFRNAYTALFDLLEDYPAERRLIGGACGWWSPKQVLDHFSGWLVELQLRFRDYDAGLGTGMRYDFDAFNKLSVDDRVNQTWEDTVTELHRLSAECITMAQAVNPRRLVTDARYAGLMEALAVDCEIHTAGLRLFIGLPAVNID